MIEQHGSLAEKFLKKWAWLYLFSFIIGPIGYIIKIIISWDLSVAEIWILYGILSLMVLLSAYNDLWLTDSLNYFVPKYIADNRYDKVKTILTYTLIAQFISGVSIACFFFFAADFISTSYFKDASATWALKIFAFFFLGINIFQMLYTFFIAVQNTFLHKCVELIRMGFVLLSTLCIFFLDLWSVTNFSYSWVIGLYLGIIVSCYFFFKKYYLPYLSQVSVIWDVKLFKEIFAYSLSIFLGVQASVILSQIDMQMILYILWTEQAGYYTNYLSTIGIPFLIIGPIFGLLFPLFSELQGKKEYEKIRMIKWVFQKNFLVLSFACSIFFFVFAHEIIYTLFWEKFFTSGTILQYSIMFLCFNFLLQMNFNIMAGIGKVKERIIIVTIAIFCNMILNYIFIEWIWVYGAALATGIGWVIIWILSEIFLWSKYRVAFDYIYIIQSIFLFSVLGYIFYTYITPLFVGLSRPETLFWLICISVIYGLIFFIYHKKELFYVVWEIKKLRTSS